MEMKWFGYLGIAIGAFFALSLMLGPRQVVDPGHLLPLPKDALAESWESLFLGIVVVVVVGALAAVVERQRR